MCGICGIYNYKSHGPIQPRVLLAMKDAIIHRGPDGEGEYIDGDLGLGHRRLKVIDLGEMGKQPMSNEEGSVWITCNGEIYNYKDLRKELLAKGHKFRSSSDTETIIHLYEEVGLSFLEHLEGMFAFGLWDKKKKRLILARDRIGIKPLYYCIGENGLTFASELKSLIQHPDFKREIDYHALYTYFLSLTVLGPRSIFKDVVKLGPGQFLVAGEDGVQVHHYWDIDNFSFDTPKTEKQIIEELDAHLQRVVKSHLVADVPVGAFLSGGVDSSSLVALAARHTQKPIRTFSVIFKDNPDVDESRFSDLVARKYNTQHTAEEMTTDFIGSFEKIIWHADEPFAVSSAFALYGISELASRSVKVVLSGDGADEIFAGYPWHRRKFVNYMWPLMSPFIKNKDRLLFLSLIGDIGRKDTSKGYYFFRTAHRVAKLFASNLAYYYDSQTYTTPYIVPTIFKREFYNDQIRQAARDAFYEFAEHWHKAGQADFINQRLYASVKTTLVDEMLTKVDKMCMAFGLEARVPFLDHKLVEFALKIPGRLKYGDMGGKNILKKVVRKYLPEDVIVRKKQGFGPPMVNRRREDILILIKDYLADARIKREGIFDIDVINGIIQRHLSGVQDNSSILFTLLCWEFWYDKFFKNQGQR